MKKYIIYFLGVIILAFGVSLLFQCGFGSGSIDAFNKNLSDIINHPFFSVGAIIIIENIFFILIYFITLKAKDIILPIIVTLCLGTLVDLFNMINVVSISDPIFYRIIMFIVGINFISLGVGLMVYNKLSPSAFECLTIVVNKFLNKLSYGQCKIIIEVVITIIAAVLGLVFLHDLNEVSLATVIILFIQGPLIDLYIKLLRKIKFIR